MFYFSYNAMFGTYRNRVINETCYKGTILKRNYGKIAIHGHFPIIPLYNSMLKNFGSHNGDMTSKYMI